MRARAISLNDPLVKDPTLFVPGDATLGWLAVFLVHEASLRRHDAYPLTQTEEVVASKSSGRGQRKRPPIEVEPGKTWTYLTANGYRQYCKHKEIACDVDDVLALEASFKGHDLATPIRKNDFDAFIDSEEKHLKF